MTDMPTEELVLPRVLFIDDDQSVCELISVFCQSLGMEFDTATSGATAMNKVAQHEYALCVTDLMMPVMDGVFLAREMKTRFPEMHVYLFTGESGGYPKQVLEDVFDKVFWKPGDYSQMIAQCMCCLAIKKYPFLA